MARGMMTSDFEVVDVGELNKLKKRLADAERRNEDAKAIFEYFKGEYSGYEPSKSVLERDIDIWLNETKPSQKKNN